MNFNKSQLDVINCKENALVYASAGTGKTSTLAEKIRLSILNDGVEPSKILCLTFTNRGCEEIKKKVSDSVDEKFFKKLTIKTFHSFCFEILTEYRNRNGYLINDQIIYDEDDCKMICHNILEEMNLLFNFIDNNDSVNKLISFFKLRTIELKRFDGDFISNIKKVVSDFYENNSTELDNNFEHQIIKNYGVPITSLSSMIDKNTIVSIIIKYQNELELAHALDFNDLVFYANKYLTDLDFREQIASKYNWIYIDESQDTSYMEYCLLKDISKYSILFLSGDFFQTIYEWRGSEPNKIIEDYIKNYNPKIFYYNINYRSTKNISLGSYSLLQKFFPDKVKEIYKEGIESANKNDGDKILIHSTINSEREAEYIDSCISYYNNLDCCILVRTNYYAKELSSHLQKLNPNRYFLIQDYQYYRRPEVKEILSFLRLIINPYDTVSLERIATKYVRGFGETKLSNITAEEPIELGIRISDLLDMKTHDYNGDVYGCLTENLRMKNVVVFDTETTGLDIDTDEVVQIACRKIDYQGNEIDRYTTLVKTKKSVGDSAKVHHITDDMLNIQGIDKKEALLKFLNFIKGAVLVGQNVTFDISIMNAELAKNGLPIIENDFYDTLVIARRYIKGVKNYKLATLTQYLNLPEVGYHDAMEDVIATSNLLIYLVNGPIHNTSQKRVEITNKYLHLFKNLSIVLNEYRKKLINKNFDEFVRSVVKSLNVEKIYSDKVGPLFNINHFIKLSSLLSNSNYSNYSCLKNVVNLASLSTSDFDAIYKEHGLIPIITVHQSKGCEFGTVYMAGVEDGMYPSYYSDNKEEEKRIFYVGITRAKKRLIITYRKEKTTAYGKRVFVSPSPFVDYFEDRFIMIV